MFEFIRLGSGDVMGCLALLEHADVLAMFSQRVPSPGRITVELGQCLGDTADVRFHCLQDQLAPVVFG